MITLRSEDAKFILDNLKLPSMIILKLNNFNQGIINLSDEDADFLRDLCIDALDTQGFDLNYKPNELGEKLEQLIDQLYIG